MRKIKKEELRNILETVNFYEKSFNCHLIELFIFEDEDEVFDNLINLIGQMNFEVFYEQKPNCNWSDIVYLLESSNDYMVFRLKDCIVIAHFDYQV